MVAFKQGEEGRDTPKTSNGKPLQRRRLEGEGTQRLMYGEVPDFARKGRLVCIGATAYLAGKRKVDVLESRCDQRRQADVEVGCNRMGQRPQTGKERLASATVGEVDEHGRFERAEAAGPDCSHSAGVIPEARPFWVRDEVGEVLWEGV